MSEDERRFEVKSVPLREMQAELAKTRVFAETNLQTAAGMERIDCLTAPEGAILAESGDKTRWYYVVLDGEVRADRIEADGSKTPMGFARAGEGFGEAPLLAGKPFLQFSVVTVRDSVVARFSSDQFWSLLACCPQARQVILADMAIRLHAYQAEALHREKLVSLGTLAAGLMHELHNPGSAAKRAASQLRENLMKLQQISLKHSNRPKTQDQIECLKGLLEHSMKSCRMAALSSMEQADAEEEMGEWLASAGVENAYAIAPVLVEMRFDRQELECAREFFENGQFSDALNWLGALVSSLSLVCAIEESLSRISDLTMAVKKFAYDDRSPSKELDVHDSLQSTLTILGHKLRIKQISVEKRFDASPSIIRTRGSALSQVWTNLIDNAADASPDGAQIEIATWTENDPGWLAISITDHGTGIPPEVLPRIFEAFFTTKPQGSGTGLGLEIVHRIVTQKFGGRIDVDSKPGNTRFIVRLPLGTPASAAAGPAQAVN